MLDKVGAIDSLIQEHEAIKGHMQSVFTLAEDWTGMDWDDLTVLSHEQLQQLNAKCLNLKHTMSYLDEGLKKHWDHEDKALPELVGDYLMRSIYLEHEEIQKQIKEINFAIAKSTPQEFLANRSYLKRIISYLCQLINEHEAKENTILQLIKRQFL